MQRINAFPVAPISVSKFQLFFGRLVISFCFGQNRFCKVFKTYLSLCFLISYCTFHFQVSVVFGQVVFSPHGNLAETGWELQGVCGAGCVLFGYFHSK